MRVLGRVFGLISCLLLAGGTAAAGTLAADETLLESFDKVMFGPDVDSKRGWHTTDMFIRKWRQPLKIEVRGAETVSDHRIRLLEVLREHIDVLSGLSGLAIDLVNEGGNFVIHFVQSPSMPAELRARNRRLGLPDSVGSALGCYVQREWDMSLEMNYAYIVIPVETGIRYVTDCLLEEMTQAMGPSNDASVYAGASLFSNYQHPEFSLNDMVLLRALYDEAITPGMSRDFAMQTAQFVIPSLTGKIRSSGSSALLQK